MRLDESAPCKSADRIAGHVIHIDGFGNLSKQTSRAADIALWGAALRIRLGGHVLMELCRTYGDVEPGALLALIGSAGLLEIAVNGGNAARQLGGATPRYPCRRKALRKKKFMSSAPLIVSISGIRGLVGQSLTDEVVARFAAAFGTTLTPGDTVVLARDTRPSGGGFCPSCGRCFASDGLPRRRCGYVLHTWSQADDLCARCQRCDHHPSLPATTRPLGTASSWCAPTASFSMRKRARASRIFSKRVSFAVLRPANWKRSTQTP